MGGKKAAAKVAITNLLNELGFPHGFEMKRVKNKPAGDEYTIIYLVGGNVNKMARVVYHESEGAQMLEDRRSECLLLGIAPNPEKQKRTAALPDVFMHVRNELKDQLEKVSYVTSSPSWPTEIRVDAEMLVYDEMGNRHIVCCVFVNTRDEREEMLQKLSATLRTHTCVVVWPPNTPITNIGGAIISDIRQWQRYRWPHKKQ